MHIVYGQYPPKFYIIVVFNFSLVLYSSQEKSKTMVMRNILGGKQGAFWSRENGECLSVEML